MTCADQATRRSGKLQLLVFLHQQKPVTRFQLIQVDIHADMKRKEVAEVLVEILQTEDQVDILDEAAYALNNMAKDCGSIC